MDDAHDAVNQPPTEPPTSDDRTVAALVHLSGLFASFIVPLIIWVMRKDVRPFVSAQAREALNFQLTVLIASTISAVLAMCVVGLPLLIIIWLLNIVCCIVAAVKAWNGQGFHYPLTWRLV